MRTSSILAVVALGLAACVCRGKGGELSSTPPAALPGPPGLARIVGPATPPEALTGVDTADLSDRERATYWKLVTSLYAPCADQAVSVAQCVKESRRCAACQGGARLIASRVRAGASASEAEHAYAARFGKNVKQVPLDDSPSRGPEAAPVTIVVWSDFDCPHCRISMPLLDETVDRFSPNVRIVHKLYPLLSHVNADGAARTAAAAAQQGRFWQMEKVLFDHQGALDPSEIEGYAKLADLDLERFRVDVKGDLARKVIARDRAEADAAGLTGTPFILINGREFDLAHFRIHDDLTPWIALEIEIAAATRGAGDAGAR